MGNDATIIAASLSDEELKNSINALVSVVESQTQKMAQSFDVAINKMTDALKTFAQEQRKTAKETKRASDERISSLDKEAEALQRATRGKKGIDYMSFVSEVDSGVTYLVNKNKDIDAQMESILNKEKELLAAKQQDIRITESQAEYQSRLQLML